MILIQPFSRVLNGNRNPKNYPYWKELVTKLKELGAEIIQIGIEGEEQLTEDFRKNLTLKEIESLLKESETFISIDSFLQHLAWYIGKRGTVIWGQSDPKIFGHELHENILKDRKYLRENQFGLWAEATYRDDCWETPDYILNKMQWLTKKYQN